MTTNLLHRALQHHQAGQLAEAQALYRQILDQDPNHAEALLLLGALALQAGHPDAALDLTTRALALRPEDPRGHNNLGLIHFAQRRLDQALTSFQQAAALQPDDPETLSNLANTYTAVGRPAEALDCLRRAVAARPDHALSHFGLANLLRESGDLEPSIQHYRRALSLRPDWPAALSNLALALQASGSADEAIDTFRQAATLAPHFAELHKNLALALLSRGHVPAAIASFQQAAALQPEKAELFNLLGRALQADGQLDPALAHFQHAIALDPNHFHAHNNLGTLFLARGRPDDAIASFQRALAIQPDDVEALNNLANALREQGRIDEAIATFRRAITLQPDFAAADSNLLYTLHFHPDCDPRTILAEHRRWDQVHAKPLAPQSPPPLADPSPDRRLRIGYISPDFFAHVIGYNLQPLLREHDHTHFEIFCYADVVRPDAFTERLRTHADTWRNIAGLPDQQVARLIREDRIDILVDLALHLNGNRLLVFARRPAPIQLTFAGYPGTTGLHTIQYRLTDPILDPAPALPNHHDDHYSEESIRLPETFWCYDPLTLDPPVNALPARSAGYTTFGCLNNFCKLNDRTLELWARVLAALPNSRLILLAPLGQTRARVLEKLAALSVASPLHSRIEFVTHAPRPEYLANYHRIDIGLDTFPYNGHTTSLDSYWMGVPVISLYGATAVSRAGLSHMSNLGLTELTTDSPDEFVQIATRLATDLPRLAQLRATFRSRMQSSPLMNAPRFARHIESAYRHLWRRHCSPPSAPSPRPPLPLPPP